MNLNTSITDYVKKNNLSKLVATIKEKTAFLNESSITNTKRKELDKYYKDYSFHKVKTSYIQKGEGKPLLFFHGGGTDTRTYFRFIEDMSQEYMVIAPNIPCFGKSDIPEDSWSFEEYGNYFLKFVEDLGIENYYLVGYSFGGGIALNLAQKDKKIEKLILISPICASPEWKSLDLVRNVAKEAVYSLVNTYNFGDYSLIVQNFASNVFQRLKHIRQLEKISLNAINSVITANKITCSTLVIWGRKERFLSHASLTGLSTILDNIEIVYVDNTHLGFLLSWEEYKTIIKKFFERN